MSNRNQQNNRPGVAAHHLDPLGNLGQNISAGKLFHPSLVPPVEEEIIEAIKHVPEGGEIPQGPFIMDRVTIPMYETIDRVVYYVIEITAQDGTMYNIRRRYRDFDKFHRDNSKSFIKVCPAALPPKGGLTDAKVFQMFACLVELQADLEMRRRGLQKYLDRLTRFAKTRAGDASERVGQLLNQFLEFYAYYAPSVKASFSFSDTEEDSGKGTIEQEGKKEEASLETKMSALEQDEVSESGKSTPGLETQITGHKYAVEEPVACAHGEGVVKEHVGEKDLYIVALTEFKSSVAFTDAPLVFLKEESITPRSTTPTPVETKAKAEPKAIQSDYGEGEVEDSEDGILITRLLAQSYKSSVCFDKPPVMRYQGGVREEILFPQKPHSISVGTFVNCPGHGKGLVSGFSSDRSQCIVQLYHYKSSLTFDKTPTAFFAVRDLTYDEEEHKEIKLEETKAAPQDGTCNLVLSIGQCVVCSFGEGMISGVTDDGKKYIIILYHYESSLTFDAPPVIEHQIERKCHFTSAQDAKLENALML